MVRKNSHVYPRRTRKNIHPALPVNWSHPGRGYFFYCAKRVISDLRAHERNNFVLFRFGCLKHARVLTTEIGTLILSPWNRAVCYIGHESFDSRAHKHKEVLSHKAPPPLKPDDTLTHKEGDPCLQKITFSVALPQQ